MCCGIIISKLRLLDVFINSTIAHVSPCIIEASWKNAMIKNLIWMVCGNQMYRNIDLSNKSAGFSNDLCAIEKSIY